MIPYLWKETDLHTDEHGIGADILIKKLQERRPRIVCFVGMGIWKAFFSYLTAFKCVPRESMASNSSPGSKKKKTGYSPEDALMPFKLVHSQERDTLDDDKTTIKREDPSVVACGLPTVKVEPDDEQPLCSLDDNKMAPITETLFFVMPNTSGLVAGYKVCRRHPSTSWCVGILNRSVYSVQITQISSLH